MPYSAVIMVSGAKTCTAWLARSRTRARVVLEERAGPHPEADISHVRDRIEPMARNITDADTYPPAGQWHHGIPVTADIRARRGRVAGGEGHPRHLGKVAGEERLLHRVHEQAIACPLANDRSAGFFALE